MKLSIEFQKKSPAKSIILLVWQFCLYKVNPRPWISDNIVKK